MADKTISIPMPRPKPTPKLRFRRRQCPMHVDCAAPPMLPHFGIPKS